VLPESTVLPVRLFLLPRGCEVSQQQKAGLVLLLAVAGYWYFTNASASKPEPKPFVPVPLPAPTPAPKPCPKDRCPRDEKPESLSKIGASEGGPVSPAGVEIQCDLPGQHHLKNKGGSDGLGLCVFTSIDHSSRWQNAKQLVGFRDYMTRFPGGGHPTKVDKMVEQICKERGVPKPVYLQIEGTKDLELLKLACATGRMPAVTYSRSPTKRYNGGSIAHMVSLPHADDKHFAVLDNNYPGADKYEWMTPDEFIKVCNPSGYWAVILLNPPPPPPPRNRA
jgi:hypothetical protein